MILSAVAAFGQTADAPYLYGIHWYGNTDSISPGTMTDVETMTGSRGIWDLEITHVDASQAPVWDQPGYYVGHSQKVTQGKGHSLVYRLHPYWGRNVPHSSDPYTLTQYADDCKAAANTLRDYVHIWQIGNEVNIKQENNRWDGSGYTIQWEPTPAQYADTYIACRDKIHEVTPNTSPATQVVLMQPVSPGPTDTWRYMDGNEFLWRQIEAVVDKGKIDGFGAHGYAEPGGLNYGLDGFWDSVREQLMIIDEWGLGDRPVYITEFNKHMPNEATANIGAKFLHRSFTLMNDWNTGTGGEWPGLPNHNIVGAMWFVYPAGRGWDDFSIEYWKTNVVSTDHELNPWYSFNYACGLNYTKGASGGASGGGPSSIPQDQIWWEDAFNGSSLDQTPPLPDWKAETTGAGSVVMSGSGSVRFLGNGSVNGGGGIRSAGYVYGNLYLETEIVITNATRSSTAVPEANVDIRIREGSQGYSLTFFTSQSPNNTGQIVLRRSSVWTPIGSFNVAVPGGINSGDIFKIMITADGSNIDYLVYKNSGTTPVVDWNVIDSGQKVGWIRLMSYNLNEARVNYVKVGGTQSQTTGLNGWMMY